MDNQSVDPLRDISNEDLKLIVLVHSALAGASFAAVVEIGNRDPLGGPLLLSLACFAVSIPVSLLVVLLLNYRILERARSQEDGRLPIRHWPSSWFVQAFRYIAYVGCYGGFLALFWSFHAFIGLLFLATSAAAFGVALAAESHKSRQAYPEQ